MYSFLSMFFCECDTPQPPIDGSIDSYVGFSGGPVINCDRKHSHNHRCCCCEVQLWSTHPPLCPHTEGQRCLCDISEINRPNEKCFVRQSGMNNNLYMLFRAGRLKVTVWGRSCSVWSGGSAERLALKLQLERYVVKPVILSGLWTLRSNWKNRWGNLQFVRFHYYSESSWFCVHLFRCWRCCGSWLTSPPCPPV